MKLLLVEKSQKSGLRSKNLSEENNNNNEQEQWLEIWAVTEGPLQTEDEEAWYLHGSYTGPDEHETMKEAVFIFSSFEEANDIKNEINNNFDGPYIKPIYNEEGTGNG